MPVRIEVNRHHWLDVHEPLGSISLRTDIPIVIAKEGYADECCERVRELLSQNFIVFLRERSVSTP